MSQRELVDTFTVDYFISQYDPIVVNLMLSRLYDCGDFTEFEENGLEIIRIYFQRKRVIDDDSRVGERCIYDLLGQRLAQHFFQMMGIELTEEIERKQRSLNAKESQALSVMISDLDGSQQVGNVLFFKLTHCRQLIHPDILEHTKDNASAILESLLEYAELYNLQLEIKTGEMLGLDGAKRYVQYIDFDSTKKLIMFLNDFRMLISEIPKTSFVEKRKQRTFDIPMELNNFWWLGRWLDDHIKSQDTIEYVILSDLSGLFFLSNERFKVIDFFNKMTEQWSSKVEDFVEVIEHERLIETRITLKLVFQCLIKGVREAKLKLNKPV
jgi:hypothetical protein